MWARNLLFIGLVLGGIAGLRASLFPLSNPRKAVPAQPAASEPAQAEVPAVVAQVQAVFGQEWSEQKLRPAPAAAELAVVRRLSLALTGTIPSLQELRQLEQVPEGQRVSWWLDHLLHDRRFADYFAERLARAFVGTEDGPFIVYRRRRFVTWLSDQVMKNRPYGELVNELIGADGLWTDHPATNFITVTSDPEKQRPNPDRLAARTARAFLGVRLDCAQCHDHPFELWKQQDFHGLAAFYARAHQGFTGIYDAKEGEHKMEIAKTGAKVTVAPAVPFHPELWRPEGSPRDQLARWVTDIQVKTDAAGKPEYVYNTYFARATVQRVWALMFGRPLLEQVESMDDWDKAPPLVQRVVEKLCADFVAHRYDLQRLIRVIAALAVFQLDSAAAAEITEAHEKAWAVAHEKAWAVFPLTRLRPEQVVGSVQQAASLKTIDRDSPLLVRLAYYGSEKDFVQRYGDTGADEFADRGGTIPQRLLLLNGNIVKEKTADGIFNASNLIAGMAPTDRAAVELAYLSVLTRRPTPEEAAHFEGRLAGTKGKTRSQRMEDLFWALINSTGFSWNH